MRWRSTVTLTHFGRRTGKPYRVKLWFVPMGEEIWVGSLDSTRAWVRNLRASGRAEVDLGDGPRAVTCHTIEDHEDRERFACAIEARHPIMSRILGYFVRGERCGFRLCFKPAAGSGTEQQGRTHDRERPPLRRESRGRARGGGGARRGGKRGRR